MSKKNQKALAKRQAKKALKQKRKRPARISARLDERKARARKQARSFQVANLLKDGEQVPDITEDEYIFWLCHGCNFIASDYENGVWEPIFDIYNGETLPAPEDIATGVMTRFSTELDDYGWGGVPRAVLAWSVTEKSQARIYMYQARIRLREKTPDITDDELDALIRSPHNSVIWKLMNTVKERILATAGDALFETVQEPEITPDRD